MDAATNATEQGVQTGAAATGAGANVNNNLQGQNNTQPFFAAGNTGGIQGAQDNNNVQMYTAEQMQAEADRRVAAAIKTARGKWENELTQRIETERDEAARLAQLSEADRTKELLKKEQDDFNKQKAAYDAERLEFECVKLLAAEELPVSMAKMLTDSDADSTKANINTFKAEFNKAIEAEVTKRLKGSTPTFGTGTQPQGGGDFFSIVRDNQRI